MTRVFLFFFLVSAGLVEAGSARLTAELMAEYRQEVQRWSMRLQEARTPEEQLKAWGDRPDSDKFGARVWEQLRTSLADEWILEFAPEFLESAPGFAMRERGGRVPARLLMQAVERYHLKSPRVGPLALALTVVPDPAVIDVVSKVGSSNPDEKVQGVAALAQALLLRRIGDDPENMKNRLTLLKEAIIKSADVRIGNTTLARLAESELYSIQRLSKGRVAPNLVGRDTAGRPVSLTALRGKIVVLVFWQSWMAEADRVVDILARFHQDNQGRPVELIGVAGVREEVLRNLIKKGAVPWRNIVDSDGALASQYQVVQMPKVFIIDEKGVIQHIGAPDSFMNLAVEGLLAEPAPAP